MKVNEEHYAYCLKSCFLSQARLLTTHIWGVGGGEEIYSIWILLALPALLLAGSALRLQDEMPVVTKEMVDKVKSSASWTASLDWVANMTVGLLPTVARILRQDQPRLLYLPTSGSTSSLTVFLPTPAILTALVTMTSPYEVFMC